MKVTVKALLNHRRTNLCHSPSMAKIYCGSIVLVCQREHVMCDLPIPPPPPIHTHTPTPTSTYSHTLDHTRTDAPLYTDGIDFSDVPDTVHFSPRQNESCVAIQILEDDILEDDEHFCIRLSSNNPMIRPISLSTGNCIAMVTIMDTTGLFKQQ